MKQKLTKRNKCSKTIYILILIFKCQTERNPASIKCSISKDFKRRKWFKPYNNVRTKSMMMNKKFITRGYLSLRFFSILFQEMKSDKEMKRQSLILCLAYQLFLLKDKVFNKKNHFNLINLIRFRIQKEFFQTLKNQL